MLGPQFPLIPVPKFPGSARGVHGPERQEPFQEAQNKHGVYIRFGDWPENERSMNHAQGGHEDGVSVYNMSGHLAEPEDPDPHGSRADFDIEGQREWHVDMHGDDEDFEPDYSWIRGNDTGEEMRDRRNASLREVNAGGSFYPHEEASAGRRGHFVKGSIASFGHDDEPLLHNVRAVGQWPHDAHRFVPGEQAELFRTPGKYTSSHDLRNSAMGPGWVKGF